MLDKEILLVLVETAVERPLDETELKTLDDLYARARDARLEKDRESTKLKVTEDAANSLLTSQLMRRNLSFINNGFNVSVGPPSYVPHVDDWEKFHAHILALGDFSLLEKRPGRAAIQERWDSGAAVPGVEKYPMYKVQRSKQG